MNNLAIVNQRFSLAPAYRGWTVDDLELLLKPEELAFCTEYMRTSGNLIKAGTAARVSKGIRPLKNTIHEQKTASGKSRDLLYRSTVSSFLYLKLEELREKAQLDYGRSFEAYIREYERIREAAFADGDYSSTIKAHKELGPLLGHIQEKDRDRPTNDRQLITIIANGDLALERMLTKQLALDDPIEGELAPE